MRIGYGWGLKDHTLEFLLAFDGLIHWLENGYSLRFVIKKVNQTPTRPHGLDYSFTLHDGEGKRILGFDNAHPVRRPSGKYKKKAATADHWHRAAADKGRPYKFVDADTLLADFFKEVYRELEKRKISSDVLKVTKRKD